MKQWVGVVLLGVFVCGCSGAPHPKPPARPTQGSPTPRPIARKASYYNQDVNRLFDKNKERIFELAKNPQGVPIYGKKKGVVLPPISGEILQADMESLDPYKGATPTFKLRLWKTKSLEGPKTVIFTTSSAVSHGREKFSVSGFDGPGAKSLEVLSQETLVYVVDMPTGLELGAVRFQGETPRQVAQNAREARGRAPSVAPIGQSRVLEVEKLQAQLQKLFEHLGKGELDQAKAIAPEQWPAVLANWKRAETLFGTPDNCQVSFSPLPPGYRGDWARLICHTPKGQCEFRTRVKGDTFTDFELVMSQQQLARYVEALLKKPSETSETGISLTQLTELCLKAKKPAEGARVGRLALTKLADASPQEKAAGQAALAACLRQLGQLKEALSLYEAAADGDRSYRGSRDEIKTQLIMQKRQQRAGRPRP